MEANSSNTLKFTASAKLMLFGEYLVLSGANCLTLPLKFSQKLIVSKREEKISWTSISPEGTWFSCEMDNELIITDTNDSPVSDVLQGVFHYIKKVNPQLRLNGDFTMTADFDLNWGLGSSSTFISLISQWSGIDAYELQAKFFAGSGFDIAAAIANSMFTYNINNQAIKSFELNVLIKDGILFGYQGNKQNSRDEVNLFRKEVIADSVIQEMNTIVQQATAVSTIDDFEALIEQSERLLSSILKKPMLKEAIFADYDYAIKSLGAWGGDFFMATYRNFETAKEYFENKGYTTLFTYNEMAK